MFSLKRFTSETEAIPFRVLSRKHFTGDNVLELLPLRGAKHCKPRPQSRISVPLRVSFLNFRRALSSFLYRSSPGSPTPCKPSFIKCLNRQIPEDLEVRDSNQYKWHNESHGDQKKTISRTRERDIRPIRRACHSRT